MEELLVRKILNSDYKNYLNEGEIARLKSFKEYGVDERKYTRIILNKIWNSYLTSPLDFDISEPFAFLVCDENLVSPDGDNYSYIVTKGVHHVRVLSSETTDLRKHKSGYIINIDFRKINHLFLPTTIPSNGQYVSGEVEPVGLFNVNIGEKDINPFYETALSISEEKKLPFVSLNLLKLYPKYQLKPSDYEEFVRNVVSLYLHKKGRISTYTESQYEERFRKTIISNFKECLEYGDFDSEAFMTAITDYIDKLDRNKYCIRG